MNSLDSLYRAENVLVDGLSFDVYVSPLLLGEHLLERPHDSITIGSLASSEVKAFLQYRDVDWEKDNVKKILGDRFVCFIAGHGEYDSQDRWTTSGDFNDREIDVDLVDAVRDAHNQGYQMVVIGCCNKRRYPLDEIEHGIIFPQGAYQIHEVPKRLWDLVVRE